MNQDVIGGRKALTPVLKRDDAIREWERRQQGKAAAAQPYPQLEYLQQQAELAAAQGLTNWNHSRSSNRYPPPTSHLAHSYHPSTSTSMVVDDDRREAIMSNVRTAARADPQSATLFGSNPNVIPSPPQAYSSNSTTTGNRFAATYSQQAPAPTSPFDSVERRADMGTLYAPMQPDQYGPYNAAPQQQQHGATARHVTAPAQAVPPSFYGASVVSAGHNAMGTPQGNIFPANSMPAAQGQASTKDGRRKSGMDLWTQ